MSALDLARGDEREEDRKPPREGLVVAVDLPRVQAVDRWQNCPKQLALAANIFQQGPRMTQPRLARGEESVHGELSACMNFSNLLCHDQLACHMGAFTSRRDCI